MKVDRIVYIKYSKVYKAFTAFRFAVGPLEYEIKFSYPDLTTVGVYINTIYNNIILNSVKTTVTEMYRMTCNILDGNSIPYNSREYYFTCAALINALFPNILDNINTIAAVKEDLSTVIIYSNIDFKNYNFYKLNAFINNPNSSWFPTITDIVKNNTSIIDNKRHSIRNYNREIHKATSDIDKLIKINDMLTSANI